MSSLSAAAHAWLFGNPIPKGYAAETIQMESGRGASVRSGVVHFFGDGAVISNGDESRIVAAWLCGATTVEAVEVPDDGDAVCLRCRLAVRTPAGPCVYRAYGHDDSLLYIGSTINAPSRIQQHMTRTKWWGEVARLTFEEFASEDQARAAESDAIWARPGTYNRGGVRRSTPLNDRLEGIAFGPSEGATR